VNEIWAYLTTHDSLANTLVAVFVILLFTGRIYPRSTIDEKNREAERWRKAYELEREARSRAVEQTADLLEMAKTTNAIVTALFQNTRPSEESGGADVVNSPKSSRRRR
jgi:hypothetical protein